MFAPNLDNEQALRFSRFDEDSMLSTVGRPIELEGREWPSVEHYVNCSLVRYDRLAARVLSSSTGLEAYRVAAPWYCPKKQGWKNLRRVYMTRAVYTLVQMYPDVREAILETGDEHIAETSLYDHYWGVGRDWRGENMMGKVWMDVRAKLRENDASKNGDS